MRRGRWMIAQLYNEIYCRCKKDWGNYFVLGKDLQDVLLSEASKAQNSVWSMLSSCWKVKGEMIYIYIYLCMHKNNLWKCIQEISDREFGISRCKLLYTGWINNKALLYSTGNCIQYAVINHNGKENEKE